jgi:hypothetical protein
MMTLAYQNNLLQLQLIALLSSIFLSLRHHHLPQSNDSTKSTMNAAEYRVVEQLLHSKKAWTHS